MKQKNLLLIVGIGALLLIILNWDKLKAFARGNVATAGSTGTTGNPTTSSTKSTSSSGQANPSELLRRGSSGASVQALQNLMIDGWGASILPKYGADGDFGAETESALIAITGQSSTNLTAFRANYYQPQKTSPQVLNITAGAMSSAADSLNTDSSVWGWLNPANW